MTHNQNPEQIARDNIDQMLRQAGWQVQGNKEINFNAGLRDCQIIAINNLDASFKKDKPRTLVMV